MGCATTFKEEGCDPRRCNTDDDLSLRADLGRDSIIDKCLSSASRTIEEKYLFEIIIHRVHNPLKGISLATVEATETILSQFCLFHWVIYLLCNKAVDNEIIPVHL